MDNENRNPNPSDDSKWLDEILGIGEEAQELGPDELAMQAAGLTHPNDMELEQILSEDWDSVPNPEELNETEPENEPLHSNAVTEDATQFYVPMTETQVVPTPESPKEEKAEPVQEKKAAASERDNSQKGRPGAKKGYGLLGIPHILSTLIWLFIILGVGVTLGRTLWVSCADLMAFGKPDKQITITITEQDDIDSISQKLADADLIEYPSLFKLFA